MVTVDLRDAVVFVSAVEGVGDRVDEVFLSGVGAQHGQRAPAIAPEVVEVPALLVLVVAQHQKNRHRVPDQSEEVPLVDVLLAHGCRGLDAVVEAEGVAEIEKQIGVVGCHVVHFDAVQCGIVKRVEPLVRVGLNAEHEAGARGALCVKRVLLAREPRPAVWVPIHHPIVVAGVGAQPTEPELDVSVRVGDGRGALGIVSRRSAALEVCLDGLVCDDVDGHRVVGGASE